MSLQTTEAAHDSVMSEVKANKFKFDIDCKYISPSYF